MIGAMRYAGNSSHGAAVPTNVFMSIGANTLEGLIPQPENPPIATTIPASTRPILNAASCAFPSTAAAIIQYINSAVPKNSTMKIPTIPIPATSPTDPSAPVVDAIFTPAIAINAADAIIDPMNCAAR